MDIASAELYAYNEIPFRSDLIWLVTNAIIKYWRHIYDILICSWIMYGK